MTIVSDDSEGENVSDLIEAMGIEKERDDLNALFDDNEEKNISTGNVLVGVQGKTETF